MTEPREALLHEEVHGSLRGGDSVDDFEPARTFVLGATSERRNEHTLVLSLGLGMLEAHSVAFAR